MARNSPRWRSHLYPIRQCARSGQGARVWGFKAKPQEATLECKLAGGNGISVQDIQSWDNVTVEFEADTGEKHMMANAWTSDATTITDGGEISAKFAARASKRIA